MSEHITILGGGNTAFATAANLTLKGLLLRFANCQNLGTRSIRCATKA